MPSVLRKDLYTDFEFPDEPAHDFEVAGVPAQYASGHPKDWNSSCNSLDFAADIKGESVVWKSYSTAISPDRKLLAIGIRAGHILIYDINSKELRQILEGAGSLDFRPCVQRECITPGSSEYADGKQCVPAYTLFSSISDDSSRPRRNVGQLIQWDLNQHGRTLDEEEPIDPAAFATKAIEAIAPELASNHEWTRNFINASTLHKEFEKALQNVAADHRRRHNVIIEDARRGGFGSSSFSSDGKFLVYHTTNDTTQQGMREPDKLPHLIIYDIDAGKVFRKFSGHTDAITWSAISPDSAHAASVSWDGTLRMYSLSSGELEWVTENSGGQSWTGAFSPDSKYIVWSSKNGQVVQVHNVEDGRKLATFPEEFDHWCRSLAWHPTKNEIALCVDKHAYIWNPFDGPNGATVQHFQSSAGKQGSLSHRMMEIVHVSWMDEGRLLCLEASEGTKLVYDMHNNTKELFRRPKGAEAAYLSGSFYGPIQTDDQPEFYLSVDGDGKARYWRPSEPSYPSWWDKEAALIEVEKTPFPETGKYVKITKAPAKVVQPGENSKTNWADKGAELWTAQ